jgi:hypothetical protein
MLNSRRRAIPVTAGLAIILLVAIGLSQSQLSDKDLFKKAQTDSQANKFESAREGLLVIVQRAADKKKTPDKKYTELLNSVNKKLAEQEVAAGEASCSRSDLSDCRKKLDAAKKYDPAVAGQLQTTFNAALAKIKQEHQATISLAENGNPQEALSKLTELAKFEEFLPSIKADTERVRGLYVQKLALEGNGFIANKQWDDAGSRFKTILGIAANNESAKVGLATVDRGRKAYALSSKVEGQIKAELYEEAMESIKTANATYPEAKQEFDQIEKQINKTWTASLLSKVPDLIKSGESDYPKSLEAFLRLQRAMELDPANTEARGLLEDATKNFTANSTQRAQTLADISDLSKIATAMVMKYDIRRLAPDLIPVEDLKDAMGKFNRKRVAQLMLSVENVGSGATSEFTQNIQARATSIIDRQSLKDLRLRTKEDYEKDPHDDILLQSLRPDGKSYAALMTVSITKCDWKRKSNDRSSEMKSSYVDGSLQEPNPKWEEQAKRMDGISKALNNPNRKKDKPTPEGYTAQTLVDEKEKLTRIPQFLTKDKVVEYPYQRVEYTQSTEIEIDIVLRDFGSKQEIDHDSISYKHTDEGVEIAGIKERDQKQLQNQPLRMPDKAQALEEGLRSVRENLDKILPRLIRSYTDRFFAEGEKAYKAGSIEDAVEAYLCHWAFYGGKLDSAQSNRISRVVKQATGFDIERQGSNIMSELLKVLQ